MATAEQVSIDVREISDEEATHFQEKGWVKIPQLISSEAAGELLARAKERMGEDGAATVSQERTLGRESGNFKTYYSIDADDAMFRALRLHEQMGANACRLYGRDMAIRSNTPLIAPKLPHKLDGTTSGAAHTDFHQDGNIPAQCNTVAFWLALDDATPEMGTMRFYEGSHKLGLLTPPALDWPAVHKLSLSPPVTLRPGDATAHAQYTVHGAPANETDHTRWGFIFSYFPAHATYNGAYVRLAEGLPLELGKPLDVPNFPIVYTPSEG